MTAPDPFAFARSDDSEILELFHRWRAAAQAAAAAKTDDDLNAKCDIQTRLEERLFTAPITGIVGLAVKTYMLAYEAGCSVGASGVRGVRAGDIEPMPDTAYSCRYEPRTDTYTDDAILYILPQSIIGALESAVQFCPELAPLAAGALSSPRVLPVDDEGDDG